jgi:RNA polymerase sigma factor (sigma-70 family)
MEEAASPVDELLLPFLQAADEKESQRLVAHLVSRHAEPIIQSIIRYKMSGRSSGNPQGSDAEDVHADILVQLLSRLRDLKNKSGENPISNFRSYVAVVSYNACHKHLRRKYPQRHSLKNRLRYLLTHLPAFATWEGDDRQTYCGLATWERQKSPVAGARLQQLRDGQIGPEQAGVSQPDYQRAGWAELVTAIFQWAGGPVELDDLVNVVADWLGVKDQTAPSEDRDEADREPLERLADPRVKLETELEQRGYLKRLWAEIQQLPVRQRAALLLNLRDAGGDDCAHLFPLRGITTIREIAEALEMPAERFTELWNDLPLADAAIARLLDVTRQQVINLRKCARQRLARRMRAFEEGE